MEHKAASHFLRHLANHTGVPRHVGQLQAVEHERHTIYSETWVDGVVGVVGKRHLLAQNNEDAWEEHRQQYLHQSHQDLTFLQRGESKRE